MYTFSGRYGFLIFFHKEAFKSESVKMLIFVAENDN